MKYVISLKHTHKNDAFITLWKPNDAGYTWQKDNAGKYKVSSAADQKHYNNGEDTIAVDEKKLEKLFVKTELLELEDVPFPQGIFILPNLPKVRKVINILKTHFKKRHRSDCPHINAFLATHFKF